jgi:GNAT superfamily N-acetyltransferase
MKKKLKLYYDNIIINGCIIDKIEKEISKLIEEEVYVNYNTDYYTGGDKKAKPMSLEVWSKKHRPVCRFILRKYPGNSNILVSYYMMVYPAFRKRGIAKFLQEIKVQIAKDLKCNKLMTTVVDNNEAEINLLNKCGWVKEISFLNRRTGNTVLIFTKNI